jgi:hypothetical protein
MGKFYRRWAHQARDESDRQQAGAEAPEATSGSDSRPHTDGSLGQGCERSGGDSSPVVGMVSGAAEGASLLPAGTTSAIMSGMFSHLDGVPEWWSNTFQAGMLSALGITLWNKAKK